ncbi:ABC transporter substrate-binding protein [Variovorax rhizosphaerae]|uniref:ABC transporter substrate-binding protein n=1 Tax=Variovorax rhizosphaerae TaxID=1836200 RepID=A0ABU8WY81_9BURK
MKSRRKLLLACCALVVPIAVNAQPAGRVRQIGVLGNAPQSGVASDLIPAFIAALRELGWNKDKEVIFEYRWADQHYERFPALARELVALNVDLIVVTSGVTATQAAKQATTSIPILAISLADPVKFGLVDSLARPGGNVTGLSQPLSNWGKFLELAHEAVVGATRIAILANPTNVEYAHYVAQNEAAAKQLGLKLLILPVASAGELGPAFETIKRAPVDALVMGAEGLFYNNLPEILERARTGRIPVIGPISLAAEMGALVSWAFDIRDVYRRAAGYADRILKGAKPSDLPIEQPTKFDMVINLRSARKLGLTVPQSLLLRADAVID